jgi:hypothetical protein
MPVIRRHVAIATLLLAALLSPGCKKSSTAPAVTNPMVTNGADNFSYQAHYDGHTGVENYAWQNAGTMGDVIQASSLSSGLGTLTIQDGTGAQVYQDGLSAVGTVQTAAGAAGTWNIRVDYANLKGTVNFSVRKH